MIYSKTTWKNGVTKVNADNMNKIEQGIYDAQEMATDLEDMKDAISGNNEVVISITDDDWDEVDAVYVKHVELNNTYISFEFSGTHTFELTLFCPYFKGLAMGYEKSKIDAFTGFNCDPEDRYIFIITEYAHLAVFNGVVTQITLEF